ncbi:DUF1643 domain-containing protein [Anaerovorax odorimutans]|uniref:DUF1643 domain-containing protein n=1 Tax=Anaerovorax odorimutans TaxID=109327 RepID=UPI0004056E5C|nr:DUF1643 domain-containing protein [Anaerovorax odorimutans]
MEIQKNTMLTTVHYSQDKKERFLLAKEWDKTLPKATVIMLMPGISDIIQQDVTTCCIINCTSKLGFGCVDIVNLFSSLEGKISKDTDIKKMSNQDNDKIILDSAANSIKVVLAWGKCDETNLKIKKRVEEVVKLLKPYKDKLYLIGDGSGRRGYSPMYPKIRNGWELVKLSQENIIIDKTENNNDKRTKKVNK